ncbi:MAG: type VI secretion system baseplate subunit TssF [Sphingobacterium sp.]
MNDIFYSSKEEIRNRIIKKAQELWGIQKVFDFDPLVLLLMEVLSSEIFQVSNDVHDFENRIFDKIGRLLAPDYLVAPLPAHAILFYQPNENEVRVSPYLQMNMKRRVAAGGTKGEKMLEMNFSSLEEVQLFHGKIRYMATVRQLYEVQPNSKKVLGKSVHLTTEHAIYLGVKCLEEHRAKSFEGLNFYFDWGNYQVNREMYKVLNLGKWHLNGVPVKHHQNRFLKKNWRSEEELFGRKNYLFNLSQDIEGYYQQHFLTLDDNLDETCFGQVSGIPEGIAANFDEQIVSKLDQDLDWIRIDMPTSLPNQLLEELHVQINAFPVVNKRLVEGKHRVKALKNIVAIETAELEQLLTVEDVVDQEGERYSEVPYNRSGVHADAGFYTVRQGGVERLDGRTAKDLLDYLFELIRDEKAAFASYNADFLNTILRELDKNLALIQQKGKALHLSQNEFKQYIVMNAKNDGDLVFTKLWLTHAELANGISVGSQLQLQLGAAKNYEQLVLLTNSKGGRSRLNRRDSLQAFKYNVTTGDRIVSKNDIINFIKLELGSVVQRVEIKSGVVMDSDPRRGFKKTTDIYVEPDLAFDLEGSEWKDLLDQVLGKLQVRSSMDVHYRLLVK